MLGEQGQIARALEEYHKVKVAKLEKDTKEVNINSSDLSSFSVPLLPSVATYSDFMVFVVERAEATFRQRRSERSSKTASLRCLWGVSFPA